MTVGAGIGAVKALKHRNSEAVGAVYDRATLSTEKPLSSTAFATKRCAVIDRANNLGLAVRGIYRPKD
jgi:hypothetical protein